jgi:hypothetical protein
MKLIEWLILAIMAWMVLSVHRTYVPENTPFAAVKEHYGCGCGG